MKRIYTFIAVIIILAASAIQTIAQTNVSGNISSNTTWTAANSPYIILDTVVLMPGFTLTIQPNVIVKFKHQTSLEINQATLVANGTASDSITFTADTTAPYDGYWGTIFLNQSTACSFNFCNFFYGSLAIDAETDDTLLLNNSLLEFNLAALSASQCNIDSCIFSFNYDFAIEDMYNSILHSCVIADNVNGIGLTGYSELSNCIIQCNDAGFNGGSAGSVSMMDMKVIHNQSGIVGYGNYSVVNCIIDSNSIVGINLNGIHDTLENCEIKYNGIGLEYAGTQSLILLNDIENNSTGIRFGGSMDSIACNKICSNSAYNIVYTIAGNTADLHNNYWCGTDTATIAATIYDHVQDDSVGLVWLTPVESAACNNIGPAAFPIPNYTSTCSDFLSVPVLQNKKNIVTIFPNPFHEFTTLKIEGMPSYNNATLHIYNLLGEEIRTIYFGSNSQIIIPREQLSSGMYFYKLIDTNAAVLGMGKMVIE